MSRQKTSFRLLIGGVLCLLLSLTIINCLPSSTYAIKTGINVHAQGATITKNYFIFAALKSNNKTNVYRCNRSGASVSKCKVIIRNGSFGHANVIDHKWGSNYFRVEGGNCYSLTGKKASSSKCIKNPANWSNDSGGLTGQGRTQYGEYRLKAFGSTHSSRSRIVVRQKKKNGKYKTIKIIKLNSKPYVGTRGDGSHYSPEIEDVMVDGDTGEIYYTLSGCFNNGCQWGSSSEEVRLYKYSGYKLPTAVNNTPLKNKKKSKKLTAANNGKGAANSSKTNNQNGSGSSCAKTSVLGENGEYCEDDQNNGIKHILESIVDAMTIGIGILGVLGIVITGIQYLTAGGNETKTREARQRMFRIVIGVVAYVLMYAILKWLLPNFG